MTNSKKIAIVLGGYVLAFLVAMVVVRIYVARTSGPDRQTYAGMYDFGDALLFLAVLGIASLPATGAALFFLRRNRPFWMGVTIAGVALAVTGLLALADVFAFQAFPAWWIHGLSPLRALAAPVFACLLVVAGVVSPMRSSRIALLVAALSEAAVFALVMIHLRPPHP
jgi:hypothetical protein